MKKIILAAALAVMATFPSAASMRMKVPQQPNADNTTSRFNAPLADGYEISFCQDLDGWTYMVDKAALTYMGYIYVTPEIASQLSGNQLTEISFSRASSKDVTRNGSIFVSEDLDVNPVTTTAVTVVNSAVGAPYYQTESLTEPYTIKEGVGFYIGYTVEKCQVTSIMGVDYPIGLDAGPANTFAGGVRIFDKNGELIAEEDVADYEGNIFIRAKTVGPKNSVENLFGVNGIYLDDFTLPVLATADGVTAKIEINNMGSNALTAVECTVDYGNGTKETKTVDANIQPLTTGVVAVPVSVAKGVYGEIGIDVNSINGVAADISDVLPYIVLDNDGYERKYVVEEGTGTWCGYCPRGIVGFDFMTKNYPDVFVGIAVHGGDDMEVASYSPFFDLPGIDGFPMCIVNRDSYYAIDPNSDYLQMAYNESWKSQRSPVKIELDAVRDNDANTVSANATVEFDINDAAADYALAYVLLQDGIPGMQTNYYAGTSQKLDGWENMDDPALWYYSHVARDIFDFNGVDGSLPGNVEIGQTYSHKCELPLTNVQTINDITGVDKTSVVALVIDRRSGTILNAAKVEAADYKESGIADVAFGDVSVTVIDGAISVRGAKTAAVYAASGALVAISDGDADIALPTGVYVVNSDGITIKAIVR